MKFSFHPSAKMELNEAIDYYIMKDVRRNLEHNFQMKSILPSDVLYDCLKHGHGCLKIPEDVKLTDFLMASYTKLLITKL